VLAACGGGDGTPLRPQAGLLAGADRTYRVLYNFKGRPDGENPHVRLINLNGILYGTTTIGGTQDGGTVFLLTTSGTETVLYSFEGGKGDGAAPAAGLINVKDTLYGTTTGGGTTNFGTVFAITTSGTETILHSFGGSGDGTYPRDGLTNVNGTLYGTTEQGGTNCSSSGGCGTIFAITTSGKETVLHSFAGDPKDGAWPYAGLLNVKGILYGTTSVGGKYGDGTVFSFTPSGKETVLYSFKGGGPSGGGANPYAALLNVKGTLYGTTDGGGATFLGTVFAITTSGKERLLYSFKGGTGDGGGPIAGLINVKSTLYGTTSGGGGSPNNGVVFGNTGTVFAITTSGKETVLHRFGGPPGDGAVPYASLLNVKGTLYGTTYYGGSRSGGSGFGYGTVFALKP
jgi:uncharacterized repeat protein (TIGR03803 family)